MGISTKAFGAFWSHPAAQKSPISGRAFRAFRGPFLLAIRSILRSFRARPAPNCGLGISDKAFRSVPKPPHRPQIPQFRGPISGRAFRASRGPFLLAIRSILRSFCARPAQNSGLGISAKAHWGRLPLTNPPIPGPNFGPGVPSVPQPLPAHNSVDFEVISRPVGSK